MRRKGICILAGLLVALSTGTATAGGSPLPLENLGHGVVCTQSACSITFNRKVDYISIFRWECEKNDTQCKSALFVDLHGKYANSPAFVVVNHDRNGFLYKVVSASHYKKNNGTRRFVMEFRTKRLPIVAFDFSSSSIEVLKTSPVIHSSPTVKPTVKAKAKASGSGEKTVSKHREKETKKATVKKTGNTHAAPHKLATAQTPPKTHRITKHVIKVTEHRVKRAAPPANAPKPAVHHQSKPTKEKKALSQKNLFPPVKKGKIVINLNPENTRASKPEKKMSVRTPKVISIEQMGDEMVKAKRYTEALAWYEIALKGAKSKVDRERIASKIEFVLNKISGMSGKKSGK